MELNYLLAGVVLVLAIIYFLTQKSDSGFKNSALGSVAKGTQL